MNEELMNMLPALVPIFIFQVGFQIYCIVNLVRQEKVRFNNKLLWGAIILLFNVIGGIIYLTLGREEQ